LSTQLAAIKRSQEYVPEFMAMSAMYKAYHRRRSAAKKTRESIAKFKRACKIEQIFNDNLYRSRRTEEQIRDEIHPATLEYAEARLGLEICKTLSAGLAEIQNPRPA
jgi:uncharacterized membrane protein